MNRILAACLAVLGLMAAFTPPASAHERRDVAGKYELVVGFIGEPALQGQPNGVDLRVTNKETNQPVEGVERTLKVMIAFGGGQPKEFPLRARFRMPGAYTADLIPTRPGTYLFTFSGTIDGATVNERFESGPGRFNDVESAAALQFPVAEPAPLELQRSLQTAEQAAAEARTFALVGIALGAIGLIVGALGFAAARRRRTMESVPAAERARAGS